MSMVAVRPRWLLTRIIVGAGTVLVVAIAAVAAIGIGGRDTAQTSTAGLPPATAQVIRATLTQTKDVDGTLGYGDTTAVTVRGALGGATATGAGAGAPPGTFTWLPEPGVVLKRGQALYKVDNEAVVLVYGSLPLYRVLEPGVSGPDVKMLEQNLRALGYTGFTADDNYTGATADVVRQWQSDLGRDETGRVDIDQAVVAPGPIRVASVTAALGAGASGAVLNYTGTTRNVSIDLDVADQQLVKKGIAATVTLPDGTEVNGTVASVGTVATTSGGGSGGIGNNAGTTTTITVTVALADQNDLGALDAAPVTVTLVSDQRENVLTVPVAALLALAEGGYGVQVVEGTSTRYITVETGMFANGRVEVTGDLAEGTVVGIPT